MKHTASESESESDLEAEDEETFECPRWGEITQYLFNNRGPGELALDTMIFDMPEPTPYKYILERGGLDITTEQTVSRLCRPQEGIITIKTTR